jgi:hypothetical protein
MKSTKTIALGLALAATAFAPTAALAKHGADDGAKPDDKGGQRVKTPKVEKRVTASCTGTSKAKLKVKSRDGRIETEFEVDQNRNGVTWDVTLSQNGVVAATTTATTAPKSGSFTVRRQLTDNAGADTIAASATSPTGEVCSASVTI